MKSEMITNRARAKQLLAFDGMTYGRCRPTDVDVSMDWKGNTFVFGELKGADCGLTMGQCYHLEGLVRAIRAGGKTAWAFLANHDTPDPQEDVDVANARVKKVFDGNTWEEYDVSVHELMMMFHKGHLEEYGR